MNLNVPGALRECILDYFSWGSKCAPEEYITNSEHTNPMVGYHGPHNVPHNVMASLVVPRSLKHINSPHHS